MFDLFVATNYVAGLDIWRSDHFNTIMASRDLQKVEKHWTRLLSIVVL